MGNKRDNEFAWNQFCKLGEMIGDGLHHEEPWISKEYNRYARILMPEAFTEQRKLKNQKTDLAIKKRLEIDKCSKCGSDLKQSRSGSYVVNCINQSCMARFKYKKSKKQGG